jgi:hypothetical protein
MDAQTSKKAAPRGRLLKDLTPAASVLAVVADGGHRAGLQLFLSEGILLVRDRLTMHIGMPVFVGREKVRSAGVADAAGDAAFTGGILRMGAIPRTRNVKGMLVSRLGHGQTP